MSKESKRRAELEKLDKASLIEGYLLLEQRVATLEQQLGALKKALGISTAKTPENSSIPPSQGHKANQKRKKKAKRGPKKGHQGRSRPRQTPDEIMEYRLAECKSCGHDLSGSAQHEVGRHQIIDLPQVQPIVREVVRYGRYCPNCASYQRAAIPAGYERGRVFGPQLAGVVLYLHYAHPLSYARVQTILRDLMGLKVSIGTLVNIVRRGKPRLEQAAKAIQQQVQQAAVIGSDETTVRVDGQNYWQWVFQTPQWAYYVIQPSRAAKVLQTVMGKAQPQVWVSDAYAAQLKHPAQHTQLCLAHQIRDLQYAIDTEHCSWAAQFQTLFQKTIRLHHQRNSLSKPDFARQVQTYEHQCHVLLSREPPTPNSHRLWHRFLKHRAALLLFLQRDDVPPTNNAAEQALRNTVIYRKVTGGFRTSWGADLYANLLSLLETARRQSRSIFATLTALLADDSQLSWLRE